LEDFSLIGNAAAVPIIIAATQLLKKNFSFKYKADVVSFVVAMVICPLWWFYNTPEAVIIDALNDGIVPTTKFIMMQFLIAVATYMSASKSYDLFSGNKKREDRRRTDHAEKEELQTKVQQLEVLTMESGGKYEDEPEDDNEISDKLLEILGERN
jgi:hypothetical protein